jgi:hypothetical protein
MFGQLPDNDTRLVDAQLTPTAKPQRSQPRSRRPQPLQATTKMFDPSEE